MDQPVDKAVDNSDTKPPETGKNGRVKKLTPKQERFAHLLVLGVNQSDAYRKVYRAGRMKAETVNEEASRLAAHPEIAARVEEIRQPVVRKLRYELEDAMREADDVLTLATVTLNAAAAASAVALKAKLNGLMVEDRRNDRRPLQDLSDEALEAMMKDAAREAGRVLQ